MVKGACPTRRKTGFAPPTDNRIASWPRARPFATSLRNYSNREDLRGVIASSKLKQLSEIFYRATTGCVQGVPPRQRNDNDVEMCRLIPPPSFGFASSMHFSPPSRHLKEYRRRCAKSRRADSEHHLPCPQRGTWVRVLGPAARTAAISIIANIENPPSKAGSANDPEGA